MSIKAYEPTIQVCLVHDDKAIAHLSEKERGLFDALVLADASDYTIDNKTQYQRMKLCVNKYTPFENTLYIDVDTLWFPKKNISELIENLLPLDFFIGKNGDYDPKARVKSGQNYTWWGDPYKITRYHKLVNSLPQTISGVFWFKKNEFTDLIFSKAISVYNDKFTPSVKWANGKADEYCFNVALSQLNYQQQNSHIVYFDKTNGSINRDQMFLNFWGMAAGGNKLKEAIKDLYNDLVLMYHKAFDFEIKRMHVDKILKIKERRNF